MNDTQLANAVSRVKNERDALRRLLAKVEKSAHTEASDGSAVAFLSAELLTDIRQHVRRAS